MLLTARDREVLEFAAEHRLVLAAHVEALADCSGTAAIRRLDALSRMGALTRNRIFHRQPPCYQITASGLAIVGSDLPRPRLDLRCIEHDIGVAWLWLAAREGRFGPLTRIVSERRMRSSDGREPGSPGASQQDLLGVRLGGFGPRGAARIHYPDLLLLDGAGRRVAIELELSAKSRPRRERILGGYGAEPRIAAVLYLVGNGSIARAISAAAARLGITELIHVQRTRVAPASSARSRTGLDRGRTRVERVR